MEILINNILKYARFLRDIKYKFTKKIFLTSHGFSMWFHKEPQSKDIIPKIETDIIKKNIQNFDLFIDIGAFVGFFSIYTNHLSKTKRYIAFEPQKDSFELLSKNFKLNKINNYRLFNKALSNKKVESKLYGFGQGASLIKNWGGISNYDKIVKVDMFDNFYHLTEKNEKIFIKMDAEGEEYNILLGGKNFLNHRSRIFIYFENGIKKNFIDKNPYYLKIFELLNDYSFEIYHTENLQKKLDIKSLQNLYGKNEEPFNDINYLAIKN